MTYQERKDFCRKFNFINNFVFDIIKRFNDNYIYKIEKYKINSIDTNDKQNSIDIFLTFNYKGQEINQTIFLHANFVAVKDLYYNDYKKLVFKYSLEIANKLVTFY